MWYSGDAAFVYPAELRYTLPVCYHVEIYHFSGTGNSLAVARDLAEGLGARLHAVSALADRARVTSEADKIGFVFPIYDFKPPPMVEELVRKLDGIESKYLFAVCTYGITPSRSLDHLGQVIASCGGRLSAGFAVGMPHSGIGSGLSDEAQDAHMFEAWRRKCGEVCAYIDGRQEGLIERSHLLLSLFRPRLARMIPSLFKFLLLALRHGVDALAFTASEACNSCGICERVCPANNVALVDGRPVWSDHCAGCFACLHWCPKEAISLGGLDMDVRIYHHPEVKLSDMIQRP